MRNYLVVTAMKEEMDALLSYFDGVIDKGDDIFYVKKDGFTLYTMIGGIGKVSMAYRLGVFLATHKIDTLINVGVAGSISKRLVPFKSLIADKVAYHDVDVRAFGYHIGQMCQMPLYFQRDSLLVRKALSIGKEDAVKGLILSGDSFITKDNLNQNVYADFDDPLAMDMESAAVAQVSYQAKIPFLIIRSISDDTTSDDSNKEEYDRNLKKASNRAAEIVARLILEK